VGEATCPIYRCEKFELDPAQYSSGVGLSVGERKKGRVSRWVVSSLSFLLVVTAVVQAERLPIKTYTTADGLASDEIACIVRDSHGFLWFCTSEGFSRFDGYRFTNYGTSQGLPHPYVTDLLETRTGDYWVATPGGVCRFNPKGRPSPVVRSPSPAAQNTNQQTTGSGQRTTDNPLVVVYRPGQDADSWRVKDLIEDEAGVIWVATAGGLYRLDQVNGQWTFSFVALGLPANAWPTPPRDTFALAQDGQGGIWVLAGTGLYRRWSDGRIECVYNFHAFPGRTLLRDRDGGVWAAPADGLYRIVPSAHPGQPVVTEVYTMKDGLASLWIGHLFQSSQGTIWAATARGLSEFLPTATAEGQRFRTYTPAHGLSDREIHAIGEDHEGNLWLGTQTSGVMKMARNRFTTFIQADGLGEITINSIFENHRGELCVLSTPGGHADHRCINRFDGRRFQGVRPRLPNYITYVGWGNYQLDFQDHRGEWWVATGQGLARFPQFSRIEHLASTPPKAVYTTRDGLTDDEIFRLYEDSRGDIWISTLYRDPALTRWERATGRFHRYSKADGVPAANTPTAFCEDRSGNLWIGFYQGGLARYRDGRFTLFTAADGVPAGFIGGFYLDHQGRLWVATSRSGLARLDDPGADHLRFVTYTTAEGLASNQVRSITEDQWGRLYVGTGRGLDQLDPTSGRIKHYTTADGLASNIVQVAFRDRHGALWFGTAQGLSRLIPEPDRPPSPPPILISGLRIAGVPYPVSELGQTEVSGLELGPNENGLQIDFVGLSFASGEVLRYQYKLEGTDENWSELTDHRTVNYARLSPGTYRFVVRAVSADGLTSPTAATVALTVLAPIWQRWWFLTLTAMFLGGVAAMIYRYRVTRLLELERVRTRIAADLHDDIGASLSEVALLSEVLKQKNAITQPDSLDMLTQIAERARGVVDTMSDIVWAIDPRRDDLRTVILRISELASEVLGAAGIGCEIQAPPEPEKIKLTPEQRRHVYLIFKEAFTNIARHSSCRRASLKVSVSDHRLVAEIQDDGCGFASPLAGNSSKQSRGGHGLENMQARAAELAGELQIDSTPGQGTRLTLTVPLR
jgi:signal transduction histidine kinase/ligand-binding sensor domain-containing protein